MRLGIHIPLKGGFAANLMRVKEYGCETIQLFAGNPTAWKMAHRTWWRLKEGVLAGSNLFTRWYSLCLPGQPGYALTGFHENRFNCWRDHAAGLPARSPVRGPSYRQPRRRRGEGGVGADY